MFPKEILWEWIGVEFYELRFFHPSDIVWLFLMEEIASEDKILRIWPLIEHLRPESSGTFACRYLSKAIV